MEDGSRPKPRALQILDAIDRFGVKAVLGRDVLSNKEIVEMTISEYVRKAYISRDAYRNEDNKVDWAEWASKHQYLSRYLNLAILAADKLDGE